ncbi:Hypothetical predicted protein, partial [Paramuricea clavata]
FCLPQKSDYNADKLTAIFSKYTKHLSPSKWFAIAYKEAIAHAGSADQFGSGNSQNFYHFEVEFRRLGLLQLNCWRVYSPNGPLETKAPKKTLIPHGINDMEMNSIIAFHGNRSFPSICWRNKPDGTVMLRSGSGVHRRGLFESRCEADENFLASVCFQNKQLNGNKLVVFTEQSRNNTAGLLTTPAHQLSGQITPKQGEAFCYPHVKFVYTDKEIIPDHKTVKQSSYKLQTLLAAECDDKTFLSYLAETQWLSQISELLETTSLIITAMSTDKSSVLISYEYGCDRTAQLSSLSQLLLDPHYRTIDGFQILIQKEWLSFGHMFAGRCISPKSNEGHGPIFLQWLDCVWQLLNQFPFSFEFNEELLQTIADHVYSCRFGTFLCDSEQQFEEEMIDSKTLSLWTWINLTIMAEPEKFVNNNYMKTKTERILFPRYHIPSLNVWESYYARTRLEEELLEAKHIAKEQRKLQEDIFALCQLGQGHHNSICQLLKPVGESYNHSAMGLTLFSINKVLKCCISANRYIHMHGVPSPLMQRAVDTGGGGPRRSRKPRPDRSTALRESLKLLPLTDIVLSKLPNLTPPYFTREIIHILHQKESLRKRIGTLEHVVHNRIFPKLSIRACKTQQSTNVCRR